MPRTLLLLLLLAAPARADDLPDDVPPAFGTPADCYNAVGRGVKAAWATATADVPLDGTLRLTLAVTNVANPHRVRRPNLRDLPAFQERFVIDDVPGPSPDRTAGRVEFAYTLRPRSTGVREIPELKFGYYHPDLPDDRRFATTYAKKLPIRVTAATTPGGPLDAPERFFHIEPGGRLTAGGPAWPHALLLALAAAVAVGWPALWRRLYPDAARLATLRRSRAARQAFARLRAAEKSPDPAGAAGAAVLLYLSASRGLPPSARTPTEVANGLQAAGVSPADAAAAEEFLRRCDAARFSTSSDTEPSLAADAARLIERWEGAG